MPKAANCHITRAHAGTPRYRCFCLDNESRILWGTHVRAIGIDEAIVAAHQACQARLGCRTRVEIWQGPIRVHTSPGSAS
jgi:hypothetical protein